MATTSQRPGWTLAVASVAAFMTSLDTMVVTTALPTLRSDLGGSVGQLEWTMNAYYLTFACLLVTAAGLGDRFGRRRVLCLGLVIFALASAGAALAPSIGSLIAARAAQGGAAAAVLPLTLTVISEAYPPETRGKAIGVWGALLGAGGVLGPLVGGGLLELVGWRGIFWVNVPIALVVAVAAALVVAETFGPGIPSMSAASFSPPPAASGWPGGWCAQPRTPGATRRCGCRCCSADWFWAPSSPRSTPCGSR